MAVPTELQPDGLPPEQVGWFKILSAVDSSAEDIRTFQVWHPFHHTRCTLTLFPGIDVLQHRSLESDARKLRSIGHPALMPVLDVVDSGGRTGLLVQGTGGYSLRDCLNEVGALEVDEAIAIFRQLLSGVSALHSRDLTHGDLRPENIQLDVSEDRLIARIRGLGRASIERWNLHSPYLAPELASGGTADPRADVFSLGCIFYESLTGEAPFSEIDPWIRRQEIRDSSSQRLQSRGMRLPLEVTFAIDSALKFHASERFANARAFARALPRDDDRLRTEEISMPLSSSDERNTIGEPLTIGESLTIGVETPGDSSPLHVPSERRPEPESGDAPAAEAHAPAAQPAAQPDPKPPAENEVIEEPGLGDRMAAAPINAVIVSSRLLRVLAVPFMAAFLLMVMWNWSSARDTIALKDDVEASMAGLDPLFARSLLMADKVIAAGVEPNKVRPLIARFDSAEGDREQLQAGHHLVTSMFRLIRSLRASDDASLNQQRRSLEVQLNAMEREYVEHKEKSASLQDATTGSLLGQLVDMLR